MTATATIALSACGLLAGAQLVTRNRRRTLHAARRLSALADDTRELGARAAAAGLTIGEWAELLEVHANLAALLLPERNLRTIEPAGMAMLMRTSFGDGDDRAAAYLYGCGVADSINEAREQVQRYLHLLDQGLIP